MDGPNLSHIDGNSIDGLQVYVVFETIRKVENGPSRLRMRAGPVEKKLVEELLPICRYVQRIMRALFAGRSQAVPRHECEKRKWAWLSSCSE